MSDDPKARDIGEEMIPFGTKPKCPKCKKEYEVGIYYGSSVSNAETMCIKCFRKLIKRKKK